MSKKSSNQVKLYKRSEDETLSKAGRLYNLRRESSICVKCGGRLADGSNLLCQTHLDYYNNWHQNKRAKIAKALELLKSSEQEESSEQVTKKSNRQRKSSKQA